MNKKNLLVLLCDQQQRNVLDIYGGPVKTTAWRQLADSGVAFDNFYCASPLCVPTRPSMMNGKWPHSHGSICFGEDYFLLNKGENILPSYLHDNSYQVAYDGIWHIKQHESDNRTGEYAYFKERSFSYQEYIDMCEAANLDKAQGYRSVCTPSDKGSWDWDFSVPVPLAWTGPLEEHPDMKIAQGIIDFIRDADREKPFAAWCSIGAPHPPILPPREFFDLYKPEDMIPPPGFGEDMSGMPKTVSQWAPGYQSVKGWNWENWSKAIAAYYAFSAFADYCMQQVLDALEQSGQYENTVVMAAADHGDMLGAHNLYQKGVLYDRAVRLPFVIVNAGNSGRCSRPSSHVDMTPTILELLELPPMEGVQGTSLLSAVKDLEAIYENKQFIEFNGYINCGIFSRGAVSRNYKYIYHHNDEDMLFDLRKDPNEMINLINDPEYTGIRDEFRKELVAWMRQTKDFLLQEKLDFQKTITAEGKFNVVSNI
jgi:arylsulfatase A-like enzyme